MRKLVALLAESLEVIQRLVVFAGVCQMMNVIHLVHATSFALAVASLPDGLASGAPLATT
jgi:hypothetical protein